MEAQTKHWSDEYDNIVFVVQYLAWAGRDVQMIAHFVEKPWHYDEEYADAKAWAAEPDAAP